MIPPAQGRSRRTLKRIRTPRKRTRETLVDSAQLVGFNSGVDQVARQLCSPPPWSDSNATICRALTRSGSPSVVSPPHVARPRPPQPRLPPPPNRIHQRGTWAGRRGTPVAPEDRIQDQQEARRSTRLRRAALARRASLAGPGVGTPPVRRWRPVVASRRSRTSTRALGKTSGSSANTKTSRSSAYGLAASTSLASAA